MNASDIEADLARAFKGCQLDIAADGNRIAIRIAWDGFSGMTKVKRQQAVYAVLNDRIRSGEIHAVQIAASARNDR